MPLVYLDCLDLCLAPPLYLLSFSLQHDKAHEARARLAELATLRKT